MHLAWIYLQTVDEMLERDLGSRNTVHRTLYVFYNEIIRGWNEPRRRCAVGYRIKIDYVTLSCQTYSLYGQDSYITEMVSYASSPMIAFRVDSRPIRVGWLHTGRPPTDVDSRDRTI